MSCSYDDSIKVWEEGDDDWYCVDTLLGHESTVWEVAFDREGGKLVSVSDDCTLRVWGQKNGKDWECEKVVEKAHRRTIFSVDVARVGANRFVTGGADNCIKVWDGETGAEVAMTEAEGDVNCVRFNPKMEGVVASCGDDMKVRIWEL